MLKIFLLTNCKGYRLPMIAGILQYVYVFIENAEHPLRGTLSRARGVLNEEVGEFSLAHLSRLLPHTITRQSLEVADRTYKMLPSIKGICDALAGFADLDMDSDAVTIPEDSPELRATEEFFQLCIRQLISGQYKPYLPDASKWESATSALAGSVNTVPNPYYRQDTWPELQNAVISLKRSMRKVWMQDKHAAEVPGYLPPTAPLAEVKLPPILDDADPDNPEYWSDESTILPPLVPPPPPSRDHKTDAEDEGSPGTRRRSRSRRPRRGRAGRRPRQGRGKARRGRKRSPPGRSPSEGREVASERKLELKHDAGPLAPTPEPNVPAAGPHARPRRRAAPRLGFFEPTRGFVITK